MIDDLADMGYAVVPVDPTPEMIKAMLCEDVPTPELDVNDLEGTHRQWLALMANAWRRAIASSNAQENGQRALSRTAVDRPALT